MSDSIYEVHPLHIEKTSRKVYRIKCFFCIFLVRKLLHFQKSFYFYSNYDMSFEMSKIGQEKLELYGLPLEVTG